MSLKSYLKELERKKLISRRPNPAIPFALTVIIYILSLLAAGINILLSNIFFLISFFAMIFSILHFLIFKILSSP